MGRSFLSPEGGIYMSLLLRPQCKAEQLMHLTCAVAVGVCDAIEKSCGFRPKVKWINDPANNAFLHYDLPLEIGKTEAWFEKNKDRTDRYDAVIEVDGTPVGLIGLLSVDNINKKAEYYVALGEREYLGTGVAGRALSMMIEYAFTEMGLNRIYFYTEVDNVAAAKSCERMGFRREGLLKNDL